MSQPTPQMPKTVLITGCSAGGIGAALVEAFHERGLYVFATARTVSKMSQLEHLPNVTLLQLDVSSQSSIDAAVEAVTAKTGGTLDYLINNSGQSCIQPALETTLERARAIHDVNFWGTVSVTQAFSPLVIKAKGTIANICSIAAVLPVAWGAFYNSSKAAVLSYSETLRLELAPLDVKVITVMSGVVRTNIFSNHPEANLADTSPWKPAEQVLIDTAAGSMVDGATPRGVFARRVVDDVLGDKTGLTWVGKMSSVAWWMAGFAPKWLLDRILVSSGGLDRLR
ncbi:oxidoreductase [Aspergillus steynii IBT 23096]|uniref:Oxidoreductase n=1 Tax=Aspergillus steynii IBT 23096 TaxID=1392250 RepID=A0A2I2GGJ6_9EURO|nr:oxidoreductase [Aspergillus steynii IBT 23096]PLB52011.1 oxidoreductase [Aspergillus steynii IBT 23096]